VLRRCRTTSLTGRITEFDGEVSPTIRTDGRTENPHHFLAQRFCQRSGVTVLLEFWPD
jgi:hypothetical protein